MPDARTSLPPPHVLEALRRPRWLQVALLMTPDERDRLWLARNPARGPAPSWAGNARSPEVEK